MTVTHQDRSNYFKGLLLLIRKDRVVTEPEMGLMLRVGKALGFEPEFCRTAVKEILENTFIDDAPPVFSAKDLAKSFIKDGLKVSFIDHDVIDPSEQEWLHSTARANGIDSRWFEEELARPRKRSEAVERLEVDDLPKGEGR